MSYNFLLQPSNLLSDDRFSSLFKNPDFAIDQESREFKRLHHNLAKMEEKKGKNKMASKFQEVDTEKSSGSKKRKVSADTRQCIQTMSFMTLDI